MEDTTSPRSTVEERRFSAASSPRKGTGLQPLWSPPPNPGSRDFSPTAAHGRNRMELPKERLRNRHEPTHHRGRAALQRRVQPYYKENGLQPLRSSLARHRKLARNGTTSVVPNPRIKSTEVPRTGTPQSSRTPRTTVEERRFSAASSPRKKTGFSPCGWLVGRTAACRSHHEPGVPHVSRLLRDMGCHGLIP